MASLDDYFNDSVSSAPSAPQASYRASRSLNNYFDVEEAPTVQKTVGTVKSPISGATKEQSDIINAEPAKKGGANPRPGIESVPVKAGEAVYEEAKAGILDAGKGLSETLSGKPASGIGNAAMGLLRLVGSLPEGARVASDELLGRPNKTKRVDLFNTQGSGGNIGTELGSFNPKGYIKNTDVDMSTGDRAALIVGGIPVGKAADLAASTLPVVSRVTSRSPRNKALSELVDQITSEGRDPQALVDTVRAMKADSRIGPADTSPNVLNKTQGLFVEGGPAAKAHLFETSKGRMANLPQDVTNAFNAAGGTPVNVVEKLNALTASAKKAGTDLIEPVLASAKPVNISKTVQGLDEVLKPGIWSKIDASSSLPLNEMKSDLANIKKYLSNKTEMRTDANDLHQFQSSLRRTAEGLLSSASGSERQLGHEIMKVRNNLVNDIEASAPGYKAGLNAYREEKHIADAFRDGHDGVFSNAAKMENRPEFTKQWFEGLTDAEKEAAREGARLAIDTKMGAAQNSSLAGTNLARSDFNQQKLELLFGKQETENLLRNLENTRAIKNTDQKIIEGSQTAMRMSGQESNKLPVQKTPMEMAPPYIAEAIGAVTTGMPGIGVAAYQGAKGLSWVNHKIQTKLANERQLHFAEMALPVEGPKRDQLIKELEAFIPGPKQSLISRVAGKLPIAP